MASDWFVRGVSDSNAPARLRPGKSAPAVHAAPGGIVPTSGAKVNFPSSSYYAIIVDTSPVANSLTSPYESFHYFDSASTPTFTVGAGGLTAGEGSAFFFSSISFVPSAPQTWTASYGGSLSVLGNITGSRPTPWR
jgi:hypothetical protein